MCFVDRRDWQKRTKKLCSLHTVAHFLAEPFFEIKCLTHIPAKLWAQEREKEKKLRGDPRPGSICLSHCCPKHKHTLPQMRGSPGRSRQKCSDSRYV